MDSDEGRAHPQLAIWDGCFLGVRGRDVIQFSSFASGSFLTAAAENTSGWTQNYSYDNNGNMYVSSQTNLGQLSSPTPQSASWFANGNNQAGDPANPWTYDAAGNLTQIPQAWQFQYDAENHQVQGEHRGNTGTDEGNTGTREHGDRRDVTLATALAEIGGSVGRRPLAVWSGGRLFRAPGGAVDLVPGRRRSPHRRAGGRCACFVESPRRPKRVQQIPDTRATRSRSTTLAIAAYRATRRPIRSGRRRWTTGRLRVARPIRRARG